MPDAKPHRRFNTPTQPTTPDSAAVNYGIWSRGDRPKIVALVGWLVTAAGYIGFVMKGSQLPSLFSDMKWLNPDFIPVPYSRGQFSIAVSLLLMDMAVGLFAIAAGLGALRMKEWGRRFTIYYAAVAALATLLKLVWQIQMFDFMLDYQTSLTTQPYDRVAAGNASFFAMLTMTAAQLLWCGIVASLMTRMYVKAAFQKAEVARVME